MGCWFSLDQSPWSFGFDLQMFGNQTQNSRMTGQDCLGMLKREEPGKTGATCVKVQGSSRVPANTFIIGTAVMNTHTSSVVILYCKAIFPFVETHSVTDLRFCQFVGVSVCLCMFLAATDNDHMIMMMSQLTMSFICT